MSPTLLAVIVCVAIALWALVFPFVSYTLYRKSQRVPYTLRQWIMLCIGMELFLCGLLFTQILGVAPVFRHVPYQSKEAFLTATAISEIIGMLTFLYSVLLPSHRQETDRHSRMGGD